MANDGGLSWEMDIAKVARVGEAVLENPMHLILGPAPTHKVATWTRPRRRLIFFHFTLLLLI